MKERLYIMKLFLVLLVSVSEMAFAQTSPRFTLTRSVVAGGGATFSTSSRFQLGSTVAQPLAAVPSSSRFSIQGGFWITPSFLLFAPAKTGNSFNLSFETTAGKTYVIEYTDSLAAPNWQPLPTVTGDGTVKTLSDPAATVAHRYYRIREQ